MTATAEDVTIAGLFELLREAGIKPCLCLVCSHKESFGPCSACHCRNAAAVARAAKALGAVYRDRADVAARVANATPAVHAALAEAIEAQIQAAVLAERNRCRDHAQREANACRHHFEALDACRNRDRVPAKRMHKAAEGVCLAIVSFIERGE